MQAVKSSMVEDPGWSYSYHMAVSAIVSSHSGDMVCVLLGTLRVVSGHAYVPTWHMQAVKSSMVEDPGSGSHDHGVVLAVDSSYSSLLVRVLLDMMRVVAGHVHVDIRHKQANKTSVVETASDKVGTGHDADPQDNCSRDTLCTVYGHT